MSKNTKITTYITSKKHSSDSSEDYIDEKQERRGRKNKAWLLERKNKNEITLNDEEDNEVYLNIQDITADFTSRDLARLYVTLSKTRTDHDYSLKSIRYWEELSNNSKFRKLFRKYKPWTIHTNYKRIFTYVTLDEAISILKTDSEADVSSLLKLSRSRKVSKKYIGGIEKYLTQKEPIVKPGVEKVVKKVVWKEEEKTEQEEIPKDRDIPCEDINSTEIKTLKSQLATMRHLGKKRRRFRIMKNSAISKYSIFSVKSNTHVKGFADISVFDHVVNTKVVTNLDRFFAKFDNNPFGHLFKNIEDHRSYRIFENRLSDLYDYHNSLKNKFTQSKIFY
jgi:hypothetical protein